MSEKSLQVMETDMKKIGKEVLFLKTKRLTMVFVSNSVLRGLLREKILLKLIAMVVYS